jgi:hypothetical protein
VKHAQKSGCFGSERKDTFDPLISVPKSFASPHDGEYPEKDERSVQQQSYFSAATAAMYWSQKPS